MRYRFWTQPRPDGDFADEVNAHIDMEADRLERSGVPRAEARYSAQRAFGNATAIREHHREAQRVPWLDNLRDDVRHALRRVRHAPGFAFAVIATLAIGIGFDTAIFLVAYSMLARPLPVRDADRVVNVYQQLSAGHSQAVSRQIGRVVHGMASLLSYPEFQSYAGAPAFGSSAAYVAQPVSVSGIADGSVPAELVSCDFFRTMEVRIVLGRDFDRDACADVGSEPLIVVSDAMWRARFNGDPGIVGRAMSVNGIPFTIIGVAEHGFSGVAVEAASMWMPITMQPALTHGRDSTFANANASWLVMAARLAPGATIDQARVQTAVIARRLDANHPGRAATAIVSPGAYYNFPEVASQSALPVALIFLLGLTIVAMACANVIGLFLSRALERQREIAIRRALGSSRARLVQQFLVESAMLAIAGSGVGLALVATLQHLLTAYTSIGSLQLDISPNLPVVMAVLTAAVAATVLIGLVPALHVTRPDLQSVLKGSVEVAGRTLRPSRARNAIVAVQIAGSTVLLAVAALFLRGAMKAGGVDPGFDTHGIVAFSINAATLGYDDRRAAGLYRDLAAQIEQAPGVESVALTQSLPLVATNRWIVRTDQEPADGPAEHAVNKAVVSREYFKTLGIRILRGVPADTGLAPDGSRQAVISGSMASALWPGANALGQRFQDWRRGGDWYRIVGIAAEASLSSLREHAEPAAYLAASSPLDLQLIVRTRGASAHLVGDVPAWARHIDARLVVQSALFEDQIALSLLPARIVSTATGALGGLSFFIAAIGVGSIISLGLRQRRREIAVRLAVGATGPQVVALMMRQGIQSVVIGSCAGLLLAAAVAQTLQAFLFGLSPLDPVAYAVVLFGLMTSCTVAIYVPSRRAARIEAASVLRED